MSKLRSMVAAGAVLGVVAASAGAQPAEAKPFLYRITLVNLCPGTVHGTVGIRNAGDGFSLKKGQKVTFSYPSGAISWRYTGKVGAGSGSGKVNLTSAHPSATRTLCIGW